MISGTDAPPAGARGRPSHIGRYRVIDRIGRGAMGVVYRARDEQLDRDVAVKVMMADVAEEPEVRARFYREAQSAGRLLHRNIITILDLGEERGRVFIVMELLQGTTLSEFMVRPEASDLETKLDMMAQLCDGLEAAHAAGIIHRDIKPGNLFVLNDGGLKILDFGVARLTTSNMTVRGHIIGTPNYMSPEQATGRDVDHRSDIFSVGGVLYWLLSGRKPFSADDLPAVLRRVQFEDPPPLQERDAPAPLARILFRALAKDPAKRYQRIGDMLVDLDRFRAQYEAESLRLGGLAQEDARAVESLAGELKGLNEELGIVSAERPDPLTAVLRRYPVLEERGLASLGTLSLRRAMTLAVQGDFAIARAPLEAEVATLRRASRAVQTGRARLAAADAAPALAQFEAALRACPKSAIAVSGVELCRREIAERQARETRAAEMVADARAASERSDWPLVLETCDRLLALVPTNAEGLRLREVADRAISEQAEHRAREFERLLRDTSAAIDEGRFDAAEESLADIRRLHPSSKAIAPIESHMAERRAALAAEHALARRTEEAIESAQRLFSDKRRAEAIAALEEFVAAEPAAVQAATELERLGRMAARADEEERTLADVLAVVGEAEAALAADNLPDARRLAATAAARLPGHPRVTAVLREAEAVERAAQETLARAACEAIAAARGVFGEHRWDESISQLEAFDHDHPDAPGIDEEIERLRREAVRLAVEERRRAEVDRLCAAARDALEQDHLRVAIDSARRLLQIDPFHEAAARLLTEALRREQLEAEAAAHQLRVAEILGTARLALRQGAWQRAVAECQKALALEPGNDTAETIISLASQRMARVRDALEQARAARRTERRAARRLVIARLAMTVGRSRQAYEAASQALELLPASLQAVKMREAAAAAVGIDTQLADDATVDGPVEMLGSQALGTANSGWHSLLARIAAWTAQWAAVRRSHRG